MIENLRGYWAYRLLSRWRLEDPRKVLEFVETALARVDRPLVPWILGAYGSALRQLGHLRQSFEVQSRGLEIAELLDDELAQASIKQRVAHVFCDFGDNEAAIHCSQAARWLYCDNGDFASEGRTLIDLGKWHFNLEQYSKAIRCNRKALALLPGYERDNRFSAFLGTAYCYEQLGDLDLAEKWSGLAELNMANVSAVLTASFLWHRGKLAMRRGFHDIGAERFQTAYDFYVDKSFPLYGAACAIELCEALTLCKEKARAREIAREAIDLVAFGENEYIKAILVELSEYAMAGRPITLRLLADLRKRLKEVSV